MARKLGTFLALMVLVVSSAPASGAPTLAARQATEEGRAALLEFITSEEVDTSNSRPFG